MSTVVDRVAMELLQIEAEGAAAVAGGRYQLTAQQTWSHISDVLRDGYREHARRLIGVMKGRA